MTENLVKQTERKSNLPSGPGPGRPKGSKDKFTDLKKAFIDVFDKIETEGERSEKIKSMFQWATKNDKNQGMFYKMIATMLPSNLTFDGEVTMIHDFENTMTEFLDEHGTCTVDEFVTQLKSINGGGNGGGSQKLLAESIKTVLPAKPD